MADEHYFTNDPDRSYPERELLVQLAGRDLRVRTSGGVFSGAHVDQGTQVLLDSMTDAAAPPRSGNFLDLGCGWGPIALSLALHSPEATIWAVDVNEQALALLRATVADLGLENVRVCLPDEVPASIHFDGIWSNPPIRVGKAVLHDLMRQWLPRLLPGACAYLVVQKNLGSDSLQRWLAEAFAGSASTERMLTKKTFRILRVEAL